MKNFLATHNRAFKAEWQKLKHSGMIWFCIAAAAFIPAFHTVISFFESIKTPGPERGNKMIQIDFEVFTPYFFPAFLVIVMVRLVYMEHRYDTLKLVETQPVSKFAIFFSKWEIAAIISFCCLTILLLTAYVGGWILQYGRPDWGFDQTQVDWPPVLKAFIRSWIASLCILSVQYCFAVLIKNFALPMSLGLILLFIGAFAIELGYLNWWPYAATNITARTYEGGPNGEFLLSHEKISLVTSIIALWLGYQMYKRKSFKKAFISPISNLGLAVAMITIFAFAIAWMNEPTVLNRYTSTVIAGKIEQSPIPVKQVLLLRSPMMDTVLTIPVEKNQFHTQVMKDLTPGIYFLKAGSQSSRVFMGNKDSTFLNISFKDQKPIVKISGTRVAENDYLENGKNTDLEILEYYANRLAPEHYADNMLEYYADGVRALETFKTSDRIKPADDFIQLRKKLFAAQMLRLADAVYPKAFAAYYPNKELKYPHGVRDMRGNIHMNEPSLISFSEYRKYVADVFRTKAGKSDSLYYKLIQDSIQDSYTRDVMLYETASGAIAKMKDSIRRNKLVNDFANNMQTGFIKAKLLETNDRANNSKPAQVFTAQTWNGKEITSMDFLGRYMVIELRAANCASCKKETPFFESLADRYTNPEVAFISLALDIDKKTWLKTAGTKKETRAIQLLLKDDVAKFASAYGLNGAPRFILIDREGKIMHAQMPMPSDPEFEMILQKELSTEKKY